MLRDHSEKIYLNTIRLREGTNLNLNLNLLHVLICPVLLVNGVAMVFNKFAIVRNLVASLMLLASTPVVLAGSEQCSVSSGLTVTPVVELYTSEGCSSCPPADKWASSLKDSGAVVQAFHVKYWDHIGWKDRFASAAYTSRQRDIAARNNLRSVYTPQAVLNGKDWPNWGSLPGSEERAPVNIVLRQSGNDQFEASITAVSALPGASSWSAYWTVTEHGHQSSVSAGENAGALLKHDFVVRQYTQAGEYPATTQTPKKLNFRSIPAAEGHARQINLVVFDRRSGQTLQAVSLQCAV